MVRYFRRLALCVFVLIAGVGCSALAKSRPSPASIAVPYDAETRLIAIYKLIGAGDAKSALSLARQLAQDIPHFQLGQLIYGDLLRLQTKPILTVGEIPQGHDKNPIAIKALTELREESAQRIKALRDRPPPGAIPSQVLGLSSRNKHLIAVDTSKSRLYVLENTSKGVQMIADHYISVGQAGIGKAIEGDNKTPLGVYYLTSTVNPQGLPPLYGGGAIPINYPNPYDLRLGKTGSGIWLHGTMPDRYARQPKSTNGCIVLANPDLHKLMKMVAIRTTPVIIAPQLQWVQPGQLISEREQFELTLQAWRAAKNAAQTERLQSFYMRDFNNYGRTLQNWWPTVLADLKVAKSRPFEWREVSMLLWRSEKPDSNPNVMIVTYDESIANSKKTITKRQYWMQTGNQWRIFFEGMIAA